MTLNNRDKSAHGRNAQDSLESLLQFCKENDLISEYTKKFSIGREGYVKDQFYATFMIAFSDEVKWILYSTTSMRTDRIKGQQWDSSNIKEIDSSVKRSYLVYADGVSDKVRNEFIRQGKKYTEGNEYSFIDNVINQEELYGMIEHRAYEEAALGRMTSVTGSMFEERVARALSAGSNLELWKNPCSLESGIHFPLFERIVSEWNLIPSAIVNIDATANDKNIGRLPSGGKPKTDILVTVTFDDGSIKHFTISCKKSAKRAVSVHQYTADKFADVLDKSNDELRVLLNLFQENGTLSDFGEENTLKLTKCLENYNEALALWALGGQGGDGDPHTQWANYILTYHIVTGDYSIHSTEDYYQCLLDSCVTGHFGTVFTWTFASGRRGKDIQLKVKVI